MSSDRTHRQLQLKLSIAVGEIPRVQVVHRNVASVPLLYVINVHDDDDHHHYHHHNHQPQHVVEKEKWNNNVPFIACSLALRLSE